MKKLATKLSLLVVLFLGALLFHLIRHGESEAHRAQGPDVPPRPEGVQYGGVTAVEEEVAREPEPRRTPSAMSPTPEAGPVTMCDFEDGTAQGWDIGTVVQPGYESKYALQLAPVGEATRLGGIRIGVDGETRLEFALFVSQKLDELQLLAPAEPEAGFRYVIWDYGVGKWCIVRIRLAELFTWQGLQEPIGSTVVEIGLWPKGDADVTILVDNVRIEGAASLDLPHYLPRKVEEGKF